MDHHNGKDAVISKVVALDDALKVVRPAGRTPFTLSRDNKWVAFTVERRVTTSANPGVSSEVQPFTQWVCHLESGEAMPLVPETSSSWSGIWSPTGNTLAFFSDLNEKAQLWLWNSEDRSLTLASEQTVRPFFSFEKPIWTKDGRSIIVKAMPPGYENHELFNSSVVFTNDEMNEDSSIKVFSTDMKDPLIEQTNDHQESFIENRRADIIRIDWETKRHTVLATNQYPVGISLSNDGQKIAFTSCKGLEQLNEEQVIYDLWIAPVYPDQVAGVQAYCLQKNVRMNYGLNFTWGKGKNNNTIYYITEGELANGALWSIHEQHIGKSELLYQNDQLRLDRDYEAPVALENGDLLLTARGKLWRYEHTAKNMMDLSTQIQKRVISFLPTIINITESVEKDFVLVQTRDNRTQQWGFALINIENGQMEKTMEESRQHMPWYLGGACVSNHNNLPCVVYKSESSTEPPNLWMWNYASNVTKRITNLSPTLSSCVGETRVLKWKRDDKEAKGILLMPPCKQEKKLPVLLDVYAGESVNGYMNSFGVTGTRVRNRILFTSRGYAVFKPELPLNSHDPADEIEKGLVAALDKLSECPEIDMDRIGIMGHSFGGYTTLVAITRLPDRFKAAISSAGSGGNLISQATHFDPKYNDFNYGWAEHGQANLGVSLWENKERYIRNSPIFDFDKIKAPLLILQGTRDRLCYHEAGSTFSALKRLGKTADLVLYDEDHGLESWRYENLVDYFGRIFQWLEKHM